MAWKQAGTLNDRSNSNALAAFRALIDCSRDLLRIDACSARAVDPAALGIGGDLNREL